MTLYFFSLLFFLSLSKHKAKTSELHDKVRQTKSILYLVWHDVAGLDGAVTRRRLWESWAVTSLVSHTRVVSGECPVAATISAHHSANNPPGCSGPCGPGGRVPPRCAATPSTTPPPSPPAGVWRSRRCAAGLWLGLATGSTGSLLGAVRRPAGTSGAPRPIG